jgi:hypothetical protein
MPQLRYNLPEQCQLPQKNFVYPSPLTITASLNLITKAIAPTLLTPKERAPFHQVIGNAQLAVVYALQSKNNSLSAVKLTVPTLYIAICCS